MDNHTNWHQRASGLTLQPFRHGKSSIFTRAGSSGLDPMEIELILLGSLTSDSQCPNTASIVADQLGARNAAAIDINSACTGFLYGLHLGTTIIKTGAHQKILVIGGEFITHYMNWSQRKWFYLGMPVVR